MSWLKACAAMLLVAATLIGGAQAQDIVAFVNGERITAQDVERRSQLLEASSRTYMAPSRQEILEIFIDEKLVAPLAKRSGFVPSDFLRLLNRSEQGPQAVQELHRQSVIEYRQ